MESASSQIFISFAHKDNAKLSSDEQGWIDRFHEALQHRLNMLWGRDTQIWRDRKIGGNDLLTPTIVSAVESSALLVSVLSPSYVNSRWCNKELRIFCEAASHSGGLQAGSKSRVIKAMKTPVTAALERPLPELDDSRGYAFYRLNDRGVPWEFDPRLGPEAYREFLEQVNELAYDLCKTLESLRGTGDSRREVAAPSGIVVYIAETSFDLTDEAERVRRELQQFGHTVLPDVALAYAPHYAERVQEHLSRAHLSIHQIGRSSGVIPEGEERSVIALQYELAGVEAERRPDFVRLPWMPPGVKPTDARQQAFIRALQGDRHLLVTSLENLKTSVQEMLTPRSLRATSPQPPPAREVSSVYLICDAVDTDAIQPLEDRLFHERFEVRRPLSSGDERELREDHEENLKTCDAVLIYHGRTTEYWLRTKLRDLQKAFGYGRERPFAVRGVIIGDPITPDKERFRSNDVLVLRSIGPFVPATLEPFVKQFADVRGGAA
jgi:hypothetical protein